jgi:hypothetical protein
MKIYFELVVKVFSVQNIVSMDGLLILTIFVYKNISIVFESMFYACFYSEYCHKRQSSFAHVGKKNMPLVVACFLP